VLRLLLISPILKDMRIAELPIAIDREKVAAFCRRRGIRKLSLFGSVLREDFDPARSDLDVLVELAPESHPGFSFFGWHEELAEMLGRNVDLHTPGSLSNYFRDDVLAEALTIYEQA
jgi:uncharacterized protein